jgi:hypothetical protein
MPKNKRKRKVETDTAPALPVDASALESKQPMDAAAVAEPATKACRACAVTIPPTARFCSACGEPQMEGLERPVYRFPPAAADAPARPAAQTPVQSVPRVVPQRLAGATMVPSLAADRPIPLSLLQPEFAASAAFRPVLTELPVSPVSVPPADSGQIGPPGDDPVPSTAGGVAAQSPEVTVPEPESGLAPKRTPQQGSRQPVEAVAGVVGGVVGSAVLEEPDGSDAEAAHQPLFDPATEARMLALRTSHEMTLERFERLMVGFRLKPKPKVKPKAAPAKAADKADKSEKKADKSEKKADKKAKGH